MQELPQKLKEKLSKRKAENALRNLPDTSQLVDFFSNDYLGLSENRTLYKQTEALLLERGIFKNGATGSRLLSGNHALYEELELKIANFHHVEAALLFNSGYDANLGFFSAVPQRNDIVFYDEFIHASIRDGIQLGSAKSYKFKHNDVDDLRKKHQAERERSTIEVDFYVVTESIFSMDGDAPDLRAFANYALENNCHFVVDEAHSVGVFGSNGAGLVQELDLEKKVFARLITFGKALGCHGAAVLGSSELVHYLVNFARSFIYTTGLPPHSVGTMLAAYSDISLLIRKEEKQKLHQNIDYFRNQLAVLKLNDFFIDSKSAIHCCIVPGNERVQVVAKKIQDSGFDVRAIRSPTVPKYRERLRFCLHSYNTAEEINTVLRLLVKFTGEV